MEMRYVNCVVQRALLNISKMNLALQTVNSSDITIIVPVVTLLGVILKLRSSSRSHRSILTGKAN
jgi:hypothetical protein